MPTLRKRVILNTSSDSNNSFIILSSTSVTSSSNTSSTTLQNRVINTSSDSNNSSITSSTSVTSSTISSTTCATQKPKKWKNKKHSNTRKRQVNKAQWKRNIDKENLYKPIPPQIPICRHQTKSLRCNMITFNDVQKFHSSLYFKHERNYQNAFLLKYMKITPVKRRRNEGKYSPSPFRTKYFILTARKAIVPVCLKTFMRITRIEKSRLYNLAKQYYHEHGRIADRRGGFRQEKMFGEFQTRIGNFLNRLTYIESHYCRGDSQKKYLPSELNITKLYKMFVEFEECENIGTSSQDAKIKESYFRYVFNNKFNIGFSLPQSDKCSTCLRYQERLKVWPADERESPELTIPRGVAEL